MVLGMIIEQANAEFVELIEYLNAVCSMQE